MQRKSHESKYLSFGNETAGAIGNSTTERLEAWTTRCILGKKPLRMELSHLGTEHGFVKVQLAIWQDQAFDVDFSICDTSFRFLLDVAQYGRPMQQVGQEPEADLEGVRVGTAMSVTHSGIVPTAELTPSRTAGSKQRYPDQPSLVRVDALLAISHNSKHLAVHWEVAGNSV